MMTGMETVEPLLPHCADIPFLTHLKQEGEDVLLFKTVHPHVFFFLALSHPRTLGRHPKLKFCIS